VEEPFGIELLLELFEGELQRAEAHGLDMLHVDLIFTARVVDADRTPHASVQAIFRTKLQPDRAIAKAHAADLRALVFQREIEMPDCASRKFEISPSIQTLAKAAESKLADARVQLADGPDLALGDQVELELRHWFHRRAKGRSVVAKNLRARLDNTRFNVSRAR